jgi:hypothetical protein
VGGRFKDDKNSWKRVKVVVQEKWFELVLVVAFL